MPPTPFTRSPEYDPDEPVLDSRPVDGAIVLETLSRAESSLVSPDASAQPPRGVAKVMDAITADAVDFHRFDYRGRLDCSDWAGPTSYELAAQTCAMRPGMARYYDSATTVVYSRTAV